MSRASNIIKIVDEKAPQVKSSKEKEAKQKVFDSMKRLEVLFNERGFKEGIRVLDKAKKMVDSLQLKGF